MALVNQVNPDIKRESHPNTHNLPEQFFVVIKELDLEAAGFDTTADPLALDIIFESSDLAGGPSLMGWYKGVDCLSGAETSTTSSQPSSKSSISKGSRSKSAPFIPEVFSAGMPMGALLCPFGAVLARGLCSRGWISLFLTPGCSHQRPLRVTSGWRLREASSAPFTLEEDSAVVLGEVMSSTLCFEAQEVSKV